MAGMKQAAAAPAVAKVAPAQPASATLVAARVPAPAREEKIEKQEEGGTMSLNVNAFETYPALSRSQTGRHANRMASFAIW
jgi:hypothetical protein